MIGVSNVIEQRRKYNLITDDLQLYLDGIENTRNGHNTSATCWEDLSGNGYDFTIGSSINFNSDRVTFSGSGGASNKALCVKNGSSVAGLGGTSYYDNYTYQYVVKRLNTGNAILCQWNLYHCFAWYNGYYLLSCNTSYPVCYYSANQINDLMQITVIYKTGGARVLVNNSAMTMSTTTNNFGGSNGYVCIGTRYAANDNLYPGDIYAIRIYNRELSDNELLTNWQYDSSRFGITS